MEVADAARIELPAYFGRHGRRDELPRRGKVVEAFEQIVQPFRNARAAGGRKPPSGGDVGDWKDARHDLDVEARGSGFVAEAEEAFGGEEELRDRPVRARVHLALQILEIERPVARVRMDFGISGDGNVELGDPLQAFDQLGGIAIAVRMRLVLRAGLGRIAAKRDDVAYTEVPIVAGDRIDLLAARGDAGEMGRGRQGGFLEDPLDG